VEHTYVRKDGAIVTCLEPPPDIVPASVQAEIDARIPELLEAVSVSAGIEETFARIRPCVPSLQVVEALEFRMCAGDRDSRRAGVTGVPDEDLAASQADVSGGGATDFEEIEGGDRTEVGKQSYPAESPIGPSCDRGLLRRVRASLEHKSARARGMRQSELGRAGSRVATGKTLRQTKL
jgi:hypothetical protein